MIDTDMASLKDLIQDYQLRFGQDENNRRKYLRSITSNQMFIDLRNFGTVRINGKARYFSHFKNNRWFNRKQQTNDGRVTQLRDEFITHLRASYIFNNRSDQELFFEEIFQEICRIYENIKEERIKGANQMTLYDIACFVGDHLAIYPQKVYVHQGVIKGAKALNLISKNEETTLSVEEIIRKVPELECLKDDPDQIESFLCIQKDELLKNNY